METFVALLFGYISFRLFPKNSVFGILEKYSLLLLLFFLGMEANSSLHAGISVSVLEVCLLFIGIVFFSLLFPLLFTFFITNRND